MDYENLALWFSFFLSFESTVFISPLLIDSLTLGLWFDE
jgi:hypothetical protein